MSPFLTSSTIHALYDVTIGGPPRAYQCQLEDSGHPGNQCLKVCQTLGGMISHQYQVHSFTPQGLLFTDISPLTMDDPKPDNGSISKEA